jgi:hypothetical protein
MVSLLEQQDRSDGYGTRLLRFLNDLDVLFIPLCQSPSYSQQPPEKTPRPRMPSDASKGLLAPLYTVSDTPCE